MPRRRSAASPRSIITLTTCCIWAGSISVPVALEGALKLKEISYIHAEGYPAAEMKHGPIALVDENTPSVFLIPSGGVFDKVMSNLEEIKARGGPVIAIACEGDAEITDYVKQRADDVIFVPEVPEYLQPLVTVVPLQTAGVSHRLAARLRRRQAAEPGEERDRRMIQYWDRISDAYSVFCER